MEMGIVAGFALWGYSFGTRPIVQAVLAVVLPIVGFGIWGFIDFRSLGRAAEAARLVEELAISGLAAVGLMFAGRPVLGWILVAVSIVHHLLVYMTGDRLIKEEA